MTAGQTAAPYKTCSTPSTFSDLKESTVGIKKINK